MIARAAGQMLAYDDRGEGPPVLFLHAFPLDRTMWEPQLGALLHHARCVAPDLPGFGESPADGPASLDRWADDIAALLDHLALEQTTIVGLSMGGYLAFALWRRHRARVRALVLASTRADADTEDARARRRELIALARARGSAAVADRQLPGLLGKQTRARQPELVEHVRSVLARAPVEGIVGALEAMLARPDSTPLLHTIDVPTLVIAGGDDVLTPPSVMRPLHAAIPGSRLEVLAGAGHLSNLERPAAFTHLVGEFVATVRDD